MIDQRATPPRARAALVAEGLDYFEKVGDAGDRKYVDAIREELAVRGQQACGSAAVVDALEKFVSAVLDDGEPIEGTRWYAQYTAARAALNAQVNQFAASVNKASQALEGWRVVQIGGLGSAYDPQGACRAYTYEHQPRNGLAWKLGRATSVAAYDSAGDYIDRGLALLNRLQEEGFGVFQIAPIEPLGQRAALARVEGGAA